MSLRSLYVPLPKAVALLPVSIYAGSSGAAGISPKGAVDTYAAAGRIQLQLVG